MTTTEPVRMAANVEVKSAAPVEGKYGPQWELSAVLPPSSQYPAKTWIDRNPEDAPILPGTYPCVIERGVLKDGKDGSVDWHYRWRISQFNVVTKDGVVTHTESGPPATPITPSPIPKTEHPIPNTLPHYEDADARRRASIERQTSLVQAVALVKEDWDDIKTVIAVAEEFYRYLTGKPETPAGAPESAGEAPDPSAPPPEPSPSKTGPRAEFSAWLKSVGKTPADVMAVAKLDGHTDPAKWIAAQEPESLRHGYMLLTERCTAEWGIGQDEFDRLGADEQAHLKEQ